MAANPVPSVALQPPDSTTGHYVYAPASASTPEMATSKSTPTPIEQQKRVLGISNLMSPPEAPAFEAFHHSLASVASNDGKRAAPNPPPSPPVSPISKDSSSLPAASPSTAPDPILYPPIQETSMTPLFDNRDSPDTRRIVDEHVKARDAAAFHAVSPPRRQEYELALHFKSQVMEIFSQNPKVWLKKERALLLADRKAVARRNPRPQLHPLLPAARPPVARPHAGRAAPKTDKVVKRPASPRPIRANPTPARQAAARVSATPEPRRVVAPTREDKDFNSVRDYCPPLSSLPDRPNCLKIEWKGAPIDLSNDLNAHLLHPDEVVLASTLRLDCATYLTSKRRLFERRVECAARGKEFRKTDAQQACNIDVNKASKLWMAYDKVGWLDLKWVAPYVSSLRA